MAKYKIAWMPGDGIGNDVMEATRIVLDAMKLRRRVRAGRHRVGVLVQGGQPAARPLHRGPQELHAAPLRRDHEQAAGRREAGARAGAQGQRTSSTSRPS